MKVYSDQGYYEKAADEAGRFSTIAAQYPIAQKVASQARNSEIRFLVHAAYKAIAAKNESEAAVFIVRARERVASTPLAERMTVEELAEFFSKDLAADADVARKFAVLVQPESKNE
jgi:hypothetical protein